jgi:hypothetical protein
VQTIKTQLVDGQQRVITKVVDGERRVSCSCCGFVECCMYSTEYAYSIEDFPDAINVTWDGQHNGILNKGAEFYSDNTGEITLKIENGIWVLRNEGEIPPVSRTVGKCLIVELDLDNDETGGNGLVEDLFLPTYTIVDSAPDAPVNLTQVANRGSLCSWLGVGVGENVQEDVAAILYNGDSSNGPPFPEVPLGVWLINYFGEPSIKIGPDQSSPVGIYENNWSVTE